MKNGIDLITGYYGFGNFGDDLFKEILVGAFRRESHLNPVISERKVKDLHKSQRQMRAMHNIFRSRSITLGGGSILGANGLSDIRYWEYLYSILHSRNPYSSIGVGLRNGMAGRASKVLSRMTWVGLRTEREYNFLKDQYGPKIKYSSDLAYSLDDFPEINPPHSSAAHQTLLIVSRHGALGKLASSSQDFTLFLKSIPADTVAVMLMQPDDPIEDIILSKINNVARAVGKNIVCFRHRSVKDTLEVIRSSSFVYSDRLHGAIVCHFMGIPFYLSQHHEKCVDFLNDVDHPYSEKALGIRHQAPWVVMSKIEEWSSAGSDLVVRHKNISKASLRDLMEHVKNF